MKTALFEANKHTNKNDNLAIGILLTTALLIFYINKVRHGVKKNVTLRSMNALIQAKKF